MSRLVIIGAGVMGLATAHHALKRGHDVTVLEAAFEPGGMAAHFDLAGLSIERFYHFVCKSDHATFELLEELGLGEQMCWSLTSMGYFIDGKLYRWGDPVSLIRFPKLSLLEKLRYGAMMFVATRRNEWKALENISAREWITSWCGETVYRKLWEPLFKLKFFEFADNISAAWIWTRVKRVGTSRRSLFQEELGYIKGGSQTLVDALMNSIRTKGGTVHLDKAASRVETAGGRVTGVVAGSDVFPADAVISTIPTPFVSRIVPDLPQQARDKYDAIENIGVVCVVFRLKRQVTPHFWVNIVDDRFEIPGIVEFSRLRPVDGSVVYIPYYMPTTHPTFARDDAYFRNQGIGYLKLINSALRDDDVIACHVGRLRYAQPVCPPGFAAMLPDIETLIEGLQIADTCFYYPEDRGISESVRIGKAMAERVG
jgi:protoporphyrinogen oxidase